MDCSGNFIWYRIMWYVVFYHCLLSVIIHFQSSSILQYIPMFHSFYTINNNPCRHRISYLSLHPLTSLWVVSVFWLRWVMLLWTLTDKFLHESMSSFNLGSCRNFVHQFLFPLGKQIGVGLLSHKVNVMFNFLRTCQILPEHPPLSPFQAAMYKSSASLPGTLWILFKYLFFYLTMPGLCCGMQTLCCGMWDLVSWPGIESGPPALGARSLNHCTTR